MPQQERVNRGIVDMLSFESMVASQHSFLHSCNLKNIHQWNLIPIASVLCCVTVCSCVKADVPKLSTVSSAWPNPI